ncbi:MAG TPA: M64 family metallopeptidase [Melioribacteraceae bacterium]|nr:M64 family metallopeptidase [Melioribacteraceae bacterium]
MRKLLVIFYILSTFVFAQIKYDDYFTENTLRFDYYRTGNDKSEIISFDEMFEEEKWYGSKINLLDNLGFGKYCVKVIDKKSKNVIFSKGYASLFGEWQTTDEAKYLNRTFSESVSFPMPKDSFIVELYSRDKKNNFSKIFEYVSSPNNYFIKKNNKYNFDKFAIHESGNINEKLDILFVAEGYTKDEKEQFVSDCKRFSDYLFTIEPFKEMKDKINIWVLESFSKDSGTDIPADNIWKNTLTNCTFYTFDSERYLMTYDYKSVCDVVANAPHDQIVLLVNTEKYGGGGIYNYYLTVAGKNTQSNKIFIHEFGHALAGLGDEYYTSDVAYEGFYPLDVEPWEANLTTMVNFESKWKSLIDKNTPIPTPIDENYKNTLGAFEGGGYISKGVFRPTFDSIMKSLSSDSFNLPSRIAIKKVIENYSK